MTKSPNSMIAALCILMFALSCSEHRNSPVSAHNTEPVFDQELGKSEEKIITRYGSPDEVIILPAKELGGELRPGLKTKVPSETTKIKEMYYRIENSERIFWLSKRPSGNWTVISDVEIPEGFVF